MTGGRLVLGMAEAEPRAEPRRRIHEGDAVLEPAEPMRPPEHRRQRLGGPMRRRGAVAVTGGAADAGGAVPESPARPFAHAPGTLVWRWLISAAGVGWSKTSVVGRSSPVSAWSWLRSSRATRESTPSSTNEICESSLSGESYPSDLATAARMASGREALRSGAASGSSC